MIEEIYLDNLKMNHFTLFDAQLYCQIFNINPDDIKWLNLEDNKLEDINGISIFKNLEELSLTNNKELKNLNSLKNLINLKCLSIHNLNLIDEIKTVDILKILPNLNSLYCINTFKTIDIRNELKGIKIYD